MTALLLPAPAKLNLSLRVVRRREDGFHEIDTLMVKLPGLADELEFTPSDSGFTISCDDPTVPADESNLVVKATRAFEAATSLRCDWKIHLRKRVPHGAGLGGGSSDAATTLLGLNHLHGLPLNPEALHLAASTLGSDIPFFLHSGACRCTGRGEILTPVPNPPPLPVLLLKPSFGVSTPDAYRRWSASHELPGIRYAPQEIPETLLVNDLERPVFAKHLFLAELKQWLLDRRETRAALMSGSGSTLFAVLHPDADPTALARAARHEMDPNLWHWSGTTEG